jgi:small-conductance mechanosensitive channel
MLKKLKYENQNYMCRICDEKPVFDGGRAIIAHMFRKHGIRLPYKKSQVAETAREVTMPHQATNAKYHKKTNGAQGRLTEKELQEIDTALPLIRKAVRIIRKTKIHDKGDLLKKIAKLL